MIKFITYTFIGALAASTYFGHVTVADYANTFSVATELTADGIEFVVDAYDNVTATLSN